MKQQPKYPMYIEWSEKDQAYIVHLPGFSVKDGGVYYNDHGFTHGDTYEEAFKNGLELLEELDKEVQEGKIPPPKIPVSSLDIQQQWRQMLEDMYEKANAVDELLEKGISFPKEVLALLAATSELSDVRWRVLFTGKKREEYSLYWLLGTSVQKKLPSER
jgi:antitoxin HicB